ncbi:EamA family transporter [Caenimonas sedimenti]|uniref:EamA family transporter n=1 Tax=Caenimonas sedimenti TaxID=2596921 RepID=A0A562ZJF1_9BURK|nr:DMT family transporter [Caenimonas sedimenti]TWO68709.1 EamA family transporter [Caenimonas sedimenti]
MKAPTGSIGPAASGGLLALLAAGLFGLSTPLVQLLGKGLGPFTTAALLYAGAAVVGATLRRGTEREARLTRADAPRLAVVAFLGAVVGPVALAWGLQRASGAGASLMLTLEALFTALLAWLLYGETMDRRVWAAMLLLLGGGALLAFEQATAGSGQIGGLLAVLVATAAWGADNTASRALADRDPGQVVMAKSALGTAATTALAVAVAEPLPAAGAALGLLAIGATGYGLSLRFYLLAQRSFGAARTGSVFACAPFIGALGAVALGDRSGGWMMAAAGFLMAAGVFLHLLERHAHEHQHHHMSHEHAHTHDDGHHDHRHDPMPAGAHSHPHVHRPTLHAHPHAPDLHHQHRHLRPGGLSTSGNPCRPPGTAHSGPASSWWRRVVRASGR